MSRQGAPRNYRRQKKKALFHPAQRNIVKTQNSYAMKETLPSKLKSHHKASIGTQFYVDTVAPVSVIGHRELRRIIQKLRERSIPVSKSKRSLCFGNAVCKSLGQVEFPLKTPDVTPPIMVVLDIVPVDVPLYSDSMS